MKRQAGPDAFALRLLAWFDEHGRKDLPWQQDPTPYRVWISEVMLQQTQVVTVIPYFQRFIARFPDVAALALAPIDEVLHLWSGLGYYARARNLHRTAGIVHHDHDGVFPADITALQALPGIGRSTAGAILALACGQRQPILDGNVKRVLCRFHAIADWPGRPATERRLWSLAEAATPERRAADYTQAIMDLGATLCTRSRPDCRRCPLRDDCSARIAGQATAFPVARPRGRRPQREATFLALINDKREILLERRPPSGIWGGLWSLPEAPPEVTDTAGIIAWCAEALHCRVEAIESLPVMRHGFTHFELHIRPLLGRVAAAPAVMEGGQRLWYNDAAPRARGMAAPVQRLIRQILDSQEETHASHGPLRQTG